MSRVVHFEIHVDNPERAMQFYEQIFAWEFQKWGEVDYWMVFTGPDNEPGINGGLMPRKCPLDGSKAITSYVCTIDVVNIDASLEQITQAGGTLALAKMPIPGTGWLAYCHDPEGNIFGIMQNDPSAQMPA